MTLKFSAVSARGKTAPAHLIDMLPLQKFMTAWTLVPWCILVTDQVYTNVKLIPIFRIISIINHILDYWSGDSKDYFSLMDLITTDNKG